MKVTQMPPVHAANLVVNNGNTAYGVDVISYNILIHQLKLGKIELHHYNHLEWQHLLNPVLNHRQPKT